MRILMIRHGDPDYVNDTLTEKGWREAAILSERIAKMKVDEFYVSPLGRAFAIVLASIVKVPMSTVLLPAPLYDAVALPPFNIPE